MTDQIKLEKLLNELGLNASQLALEIGMKRAETLYQILKGKINMSFKVKAMIIQHYSTINLTWLDTGQGAIINDNPTTSQENKGLINCNSEVEILETITKLQESPSLKLWGQLTAMVKECIAEKKLFRDQLLKFKRDLSTGPFTFFH